MFLSYLIYPLHLWCVNLAVGATLVSLWLEFKGRSSNLAWRVNVDLARFAWHMLIVGMVTGVAHAVLIWDESWTAKVKIAGSRVMFGGIELLTSLVLMIGYAFWLKRNAAPRSLWSLLRWLFPLIAGTNLLYHFPSLFGVLRRLDVSRYSPDSRLTSSEFRSAMIAGDVVAPWIHFGFSCVAVAGIFGCLIALRYGRNSDARLASDADSFTDECRKLCSVMAWTSAIATLFQWIAGPLVFVFQRRSAQFDLTGGDWILTGWFLQSVLLAAVLTAMQLRLALRPTDHSLAWLVALMQVIVIFSMSLIVLVTR